MANPTQPNPSLRRDGSPCTKLKQPPFAFEVPGYPSTSPSQCGRYLSVVPDAGACDGGEEEDDDDEEDEEAEAEEDAEPEHPTLRRVVDARARRAQRDRV